MSTDNKTSLVIENQFPKYVVDEGPVLIEFVKAYYQWMEQSNNVIDRSNSMLSLRDIDDTEDSYIQWFEKEVLPSVPRRIISDKRLFAKRVLDLYRSRGSEKSYKTLFRALFDEEIEFFYPGEFILRASDGRWDVKQSLRVGAPSEGNINDLEGEFVFGITSGASARIEQIIDSTEQGIIVKELFFSSLAGEFTDGEVIRNTGETITATIINTTGPVSDVTIVDGGTGHHVGDEVDIIQIGGIDAVGEVTAVTDQSAVEWSIIDGGSGYQTNSTINIDHRSGVGTSYTIDTLSDTELIALNEDLLSSMLLVELDQGPLFISAGANTADVSASMAVANLSTALSAAFSYINDTFGTINSITTTSFGYDYSTLPTTDVRQQNIFQLELDNGSGGLKGGDAVITSSRLTGSIVDVEVDFDERGSGYSPIIIASLENQTRAGTTDATGFPQVTGVVTNPGKYTDTKGWLSWDNKLQDNFYYQEYSYDIRSKQSLRNYSTAVKKSIHPAGVKMFGTVVGVTVSDTVASSGTVNESNTIRTVWVQGQGNLNIANTGKSANGQGTFFGNTGDLTNTSIIMISGGYYTVNNHTSNAAFTLDLRYEGPDHANVIYYLLSNTEILES